MSPRSSRASPRVGSFASAASAERAAARFAAPSEPLPLERRLGEAFAARAVLRVGLEPFAQRAPATDEDFVGDLVRRAALAVVDDEQPAFDERGERVLRVVADRELGLGAAHARAAPPR